MDHVFFSHWLSLQKATLYLSFSSHCMHTNPVPRGCELKINEMRSLCHWKSLHVWMVNLYLFIFVAVFHLGPAVL